MEPKMAIKEWIAQYLLFGWYRARSFHAGYRAGIKVKERVVQMIAFDLENGEIEHALDLARCNMSDD